MTETTRTRKTRVEEKTTIEIDGDELVAILAKHYGLDDRTAVEVVVDCDSHDAVTLNEYIAVRISQTIVSRDDTETMGDVPVDPTDLAQQRGVGLGVSPPGVRRMPRREPLPPSGDEALGQDKG